MQVPVSALIPTYNRAHFLREAINSILSGTAVPQELIVVDDGSSDGTAETVRDFGGRVRYSWQANSGKSAALNHALDLVGQPYIWIMDDDDLAQPQGLEKLFAALDPDAEAGFSYGRYEVFSDGIVAEQRLPLMPHPGAETFHLGELYGCSVLQPAMLVRRECFLAVGAFDATLLRSQDYDMLLRLARRFRGVAIDDLVFRQRQHDGPRGTSELQQRDATSLLLWRDYGRRIFREIHATYALDEYLPQAERGDPAARHRALVRRAGFMGRRGLWDLALADLSLAGQCHRQRLTAGDAAVFQAALFPQSPDQDAVPLSAIWQRIGVFGAESGPRLRHTVELSRRALWRSRLRRLLGPGMEVARRVREAVSQNARPPRPMA